MSRICIFSIKLDEDYLAITCHLDDAQWIRDIQPILNAQYSTPQSAAKLILLGDIEYFSMDKVSAYRRDWGFEWSEVKPIHFESSTQLIHHSAHQEIEALFLFDKDQWSTIEFLTPNTSKYDLRLDKRLA